MAKPELGTKRVCVSCGTKFYDLTKVPAVCPKCGTEQPTEAPKARRPGGNVTEEKRPKKTTTDDIDTETDVADEEGEDVPEDASELEDDADAIPDEIEVESDDDKPEH